MDLDRVLPLFACLVGFPLSVKNHPQVDVNLNIVRLNGQDVVKGRFCGVVLFEAEVHEAFFAPGLLVIGIVFQRQLEFLQGIFIERHFGEFQPQVVV